MQEALDFLPGYLVNPNILKILIQTIFMECLLNLHLRKVSFRGALFFSLKNYFCSKLNPLNGMSPMDHSGVL